MRKKLDTLGLVLITTILAFSIGLQAAQPFTGTTNTLGTNFLETDEIKFYEELWWDTENRTDTIAYPEQAASYIIVKDGSTYYAKNGTTGQIDYSGTDAATVIQNSINTLTGGGTISITTGEYTISSSIVLTQNIDLIGVGRDYDRVNATVLKLGNGVNDDLIKISYSSGGEDQGWNQISKLSLSGNSAQQTAGSGIYLKYARRVILEDLVIADFKQYAIEMEVCEQIWINNNFLMGCGIYGSFLNSAKITENEITAGTTNYGIYTSGVSSGNLITGNDVYSCLLGMFLYNGFTGGIITKNKVWSSEQHGIQLNVIATNNTISLNIIKENSQQTGNVWSGIAITNTVGEACLDNILIGNRLFDSQGTQTQKYGIILADDTDYTTIIGNDVRGNVQSVGMSLVGSNNLVKHNLGFTTENSGTQTCADNENIAHGLAGTPTMVQVTPMNDTYDSVPVIATVDWTGVDGTNIQVGLYWVNGTAIATDIILVSWSATYEP